MACAKRLQQLCSSNGGVYIKAAQLLSTAQSVPVQYRRQGTAGVHVCCHVQSKHLLPALRYTDQPWNQYLQQARILGGMQDGSLQAYSPVGTDTFALLHAKVACRWHMHNTVAVMLMDLCLSAASCRQ